MFARAGAVIPMAEPNLRVGEVEGPLVVTLFPGTSGQARLYEDAGDDTGYLRGASATTSLMAKWSEGGRRVSVVVGAASGSYPGQPVARGLTVRVPGALPPTSVMADVDSVPYRADGAAPGWRYDGARLEVVVRLPDASVNAGRTVDITFADGDAALVDGSAGRLRRIRAAVDVLEGLWPTEWAPESLVALGQAGWRVQLNPATAVEELDGVQSALPAEIAKVRGLAGEPSLVARALALLGAGAAPER